MNETVLQYLKRVLPSYNADYLDVTGRPFNRFYCPILNKEAGLEDSLCRGHILPESTGGKMVVPQLERVDNFFGSSVQSKAASWAEAQDMNDIQLLADSKIEKTLGKRVFLNNKEVTLIATGESIAPLPSSFTAAQVVLPHSNTVKWFGLKITAAEAALSINEDTKVTVTNRLDPSSSIFATLLHASHLTLFHFLKYRYVYSCSGQSVAHLLRTYYESCIDGQGGKPRDMKQCQDIADDIFQDFKHTFRQLEYIPDRISESSCISRWFLSLVDIADSPWALGVIVKMGSTVNLVLLPESTLDGVVAYERFRKDPSPTIRYNFVRLKEDNSSWERDLEYHQVPWPSD